MLTVVALAIILALLVLSNLSFDKGSNGNFDHKSYGWPLVWHRFVSFDYGPTIGWYWSASRLAGNVAAWLVMLAATTGGCEWLLRRYRPRFRWSLRTMLAGMGLLAASCAWFAAARDRASLQDEIIKELAWHNPGVAVERWGPQWFDLFGVDRFRRRIVVARVHANIRGMDAAQVEALLPRLAGLHELQSLDLDLNQLTHGVPAALSQLPQLKNLRIHAVWPAAGSEQISHQCLLAISKMAQLERLELSGMMIKSESLACLGELASLRSLAFAAAKRPDGDTPLLSCVPPLPRLESLELHGVMVERESLASFGELANLRSLAILGAKTPGDEEPLLSSLPPLPRVDTLDLNSSQLCGQDLHRLAALPRLKSLSLGGASFRGDALSELSHLEFVEEVQIGNYRNDEVDLAAQLEALPRMDRLRVVHISFLDDEQHSPGVSYERVLKLDHGDSLTVWYGDVERVRRALDALREAKPGIVVDAGRNDLKWYDWPDESAWSGYDRLPDHNPSWWPACDEPWLTAAKRANFERKGGWARFDAAGWGAEEERFASF
jgi:hypothetical protein